MCSGEFALPTLLAGLNRAAGELSERVGDALISRIGLAERETGVASFSDLRLPTRGEVCATSARSCVGLIPRFAEAARAVRSGDAERSRGGVAERGARGDVADRRVRGDSDPFISALHLSCT